MKSMIKFVFYVLLIENGCLVVKVLVYIVFFLGLFFGCFLFDEFKS